MGKRADQVQVEGGETVVWHGDGGEGRLGMTGHFGALTWEAGPAKGLDIGRHAAPHIAVTHILECGIATCVSEAVHLGQESRHARSGYNGARSDGGQGGVAEQTQF